MADYISRQKAIEAIMDLPNCPNGYSDTYDKECIIGTIEEVPTADVRENIKAHWVTQKIGNGETRYTCPECGASYQADSRDRWEFRFCPNCGADMRGEQDGEVH